MTYLGEFRINWRYIAAATFGLACGYALNIFINGLFAPHLMAEFGWTKAQYALIGLTILIGVITMPIAGRLNDKLGVRRMAGFGVVCAPLLYVALSLQTGSFALFFAINVLQLMLVGTTTTSMVYSRLIAERFVAARGLALALGASAPAIMAAIAMPPLARLIEAEGWRTGYIVVAIGVGAVGLLALLLIPRRHDTTAVAHGSRRTAREDYPEILRSRAFRLIFAGKYLCVLTMMAQASQFQLVFIEKGLTAQAATGIVALYAVGVGVGRFVSGLALDRFPSHIVAAIAFGMPGLGLFALGTGMADPTFLAAAVLVIGMSSGAEMDVTAYLVMRFFRVEIFSTVYSLTAVVIALSAGTGTLLLSLSQKLELGFGPFYMGCGVLALIGGLFFLPLGRLKPVAPAAESAE
jgi:MFS family permease